MRLEGNLKSWNDARGFGYIEPAQGGQEVFVHIKAFPGGSGRPQPGQALTFEVEVGPSGKKRAHSVQYPVRGGASRPKRAESPAPWTAPRILVIPAFLGVCYFVSQNWGVKPIIFLGYIIASGVALLAYAFDKAAAVRRDRRTPEVILHIIGLVGGWPGALLAQQWLRHKSSKPSFVAAFWLTVALNVGAFVVWHAVVLPRAWAGPH